MKRLIKLLIKKSGILNLLIKLTAVIDKDKSSPMLTPEEAMRRLNDFSPDPKTSAYRTARNIENPLWDLDIIVPCYNAEKTVRKCINSCLDQKSSYSFRIIAVNDGSKDSTPQILEEYKKLPNVLVIHQENRGLSGARNAGLDASRSKYVMFLDSDDFISSDAIEKMMSVAIKNDAALVEGGYVTIDENNKIINRFPTPAGKLNPAKAGTFKGMACAKIIKTNIFRNIQFPEHYLYEDTIVRAIIFDIIAQSNQTAYGISDCIYYYYFGNPTNISHTTPHKPKCLDTFYITLSTFNDREKFGLTIDKDFYESILYQIRSNYIRTRFMPSEIQEAVFVATRHFFISNFLGYRTEKENLKYLEKSLIDNNFKLYKTAARYTPV